MNLRFGIDETNRIEIARHQNELPRSASRSMRISTTQWVKQRLRENFATVDFRMISQFDYEYVCLKVKSSGKVWAPERCWPVRQVMVRCRFP
jgi:hypothetical protein